jgi:DUF2958 family protein
MIDTQRERRGHLFLPPPIELAQMPKLYQTERTDADEKIIVVHYFAAASDWWIAEIEPGHEDGPLAFGYMQLNANHPEGGEWGYVNLAELEQLNACDGLVIVERDLHWRPRPWRLVAKGE